MPVLIREYQQNIINQGKEILQNYHLLYLAMQTRTGKTLTALSIAEGFKSVLFVTKKKAIQSIQNDYDLLQPSYKITIINYESVHKIEGYFDLIICDEAHSIGQFPKPNNRAKKIKEISYNLPVIYLSATPTPESYSQLYHQFFISKYSPFVAYRNFYKWAYEFVTIKKKYLYNKEINDYSEADKHKIWNNIKHLFITLTQDEAGFEIEVKEEILTVQMPDKIRKIIKKLNTDNIYMDEKYTILADTAVKLMQKTHQLCSGTVIDEDGYQIISNYKAEFLKQKFKFQKIAIFYKFKSELEILKLSFPEFTLDPYYFQNDNNSIFLGQFQSAREGIRLDKADAIIFFNIDFSYLSYEQARNRIASFERKKDAKLYWLFSDHGIEWRIYKMVKNKQNYTISIYDRNEIRTSMEQESYQARLAFN